MPAIDRHPLSTNIIFHAISRVVERGSWVRVRMCVLLCTRVGMHGPWYAWHLQQWGVCAFMRAWNTHGGLCLCMEQSMHMALRSLQWHNEMITFFYSAHSALQTRVYKSRVDKGAVLQLVS